MAGIFLALSHSQHDNVALYNLLLEGQNNPYEKSKLAALQTGVYQVPSLVEICLFNAKKTLSKSEIENKKDKMPAEVYSRLVN